MPYPARLPRDLPEALPFSFDLIAPGVSPRVPDPNLLGIEVSDPALAALCGLGNIDPQHTPGAAATVPAAIEASLHAPLPPAGSRLVTVRPDLDAFGAMAVLCLRALGRRVDAAMTERISRIAALDRHDRGPWPGPRPLPRTAQDFAEDWPGADLAQLGACMRDRSLMMEQRVRAMLHWLETEAVPEGYHDGIAASHAALLRSLRLGTTIVETALQGRVAVVKSTHPGALGLGYRRAKIVVALNPVFAFTKDMVGRKYTIARWSAGDADLDVVAHRLGAIEPGWGGQSGITGSPQFAPSALTLDQVLCALHSVLCVKGSEADG